MLDKLPFGCKQISREAPAPIERWFTDAYCHLNIRLDQRADIDWDFRIFHWDAAWGWEWSSYFAQELGNVIGDMVENPAGAIVQRASDVSTISSEAVDPVEGTSPMANGNATGG